MAEKLLMLALSPTMDTGVIAQWTRNEGDTISSGDVLCEVETDKATMEYESGMDGTLLKIIVEKGGQAAVGDVIGVVGEPGEDISALLAEIESEVHAKEPASAAVVVEQKPAEAEIAATSPAAAMPPPAAPRPAPAPAVPGRKIKASPLARKLAEQAGLPLASIPGSGPGGRIVKKDVEAAMALGIPMPSAETVPEPKPEVSPVPVQPMIQEDIPISQKRRIIAQRLAESKFSAPHYYLKVRVLMDELIRTRTELNKTAPAKLSMNAFLIKLAAEALKRHPEINASWQGETIRRFGRTDIGLAVAVPDGLLAPVIRDCGNKGFGQIDRELKELVDKAQTNKIQPEEFTGATFTITNLGSFGIEEFTAIINPPGSAILAVGEISREVLPAEDDELQICSTMRMTLSCDHRVIDGVVGAAFMNTLKLFIENPVKALL
jgi:pyruvate dehydrogenase E2 component (dihydrolipoamide acetyltransferase)